MSLTQSNSCGKRNILCVAIRKAWLSFSWVLARLGSCWFVVVTSQCVAIGGRRKSVWRRRRSQ
jgi:hypothetical protein